MTSPKETAAFKISDLPKKMDKLIQTYEGKIANIRRFLEVKRLGKDRERELAESREAEKLRQTIKEGDK